MLLARLSGRELHHSLLTERPPGDDLTGIVEDRDVHRPAPLFFVGDGCMERIQG